MFKPGETLKHIDITIIDDDEWEENEVFFLKLARFDYKDDTVEIGDQSITEVTIINDDGKDTLENHSASFKVLPRLNFVPRRREALGTRLAKATSEKYRELV